ncbi:MAG: transglycosylase SLT domain-containing protein [Oligoflexales bacterium]
MLLNRYLLGTCSRLFILCTLMSACVGLEDKSISEKVKPLVVDQTENQQDDPLNASQIEKDSQDLLGEGFCKDDIYTTYLKNEFYTGFDVKHKRKRLSSGRWRRYRENSALHHAASRLAPRTEDYFGSIPVVVTPEVQFWISYFKTKGRHSFIKWLVRGESVKSTIMPILAKEGMPKELFYLAMIESGFSNSAYSKARASGPWQFVAGTAKMYGLKINYWVDERKDPLKATTAAAAYLRDLYSRFGNWYLAMSAYNAGPGKVNYAIRRLRTNDFWRIIRSRYWRLETRNYVPKMLAALLLGVSPQKYGFDVKAHHLDQMPDSIAYIKEPVQLNELADHLGISRSLLKKWNPELLRGITPPRWHAKDGYPLRIASSHANRVAEVLPRLSKLHIKDVHMHKIRKGETLGRIASQYRVSVRKLMQFNRSLSPRRLRIGKLIAVPIPPVAQIKR